MQLAKQIIATKYPYILPIRYIAHHINLITSHIIKLDFAKNVFTKCQNLITFFKTSYRAGAALQEDIINSFIKGGGLKISVKTRWFTAWNCCNSIIRLENSLKNVLENQPEIFQNALSLKNILHNCQFWQDVEQLENILAPAKRAIQAVEAKSSNMALCFLELVKMAIAIKNISNIIDLNFKTYALKFIISIGSNLIF
ncbi:ribonuclease H-like domain-containing protein [Gigaspora rosea]|uniref:Ribonuclease H-like domain-containing protein n=1 Tax=Gigaspora rosea TaxID=44941 RepID=A0A397UBZ0_9GLOM|nr:ribonuclease H-like domain-containing protein [Gigaspora rosea]